MKSFLTFKISPKRDWLIILSSFAILLLVISIVAWQIYLSNKIGGEYVQINETKDQAPIKSISIERLEALIVSIKKRADNFGSIQKGI